jgi:uncharacterized membrane protein YbhN (UPF0104 family)
MRFNLFENGDDFKDFINFITGVAWVGVVIFVMAGIAMMAINAFGWKL